MEGGGGYYRNFTAVLSRNCFPYFTGIIQESAYTAKTKHSNSSKGGITKTVPGQRPMQDLIVSNPLSHIFAKEGK